MFPSPMAGLSVRWDDVKYLLSWEGIVNKGEMLCFPCSWEHREPGDRLLYKYYSRKRHVKVV